MFHQELEEYRSNSRGALWARIQTYMPSADKRSVKGRPAHFVPRRYQGGVPFPSSITWWKTCDLYLTGPICNLSVEGWYCRHASNANPLEARIHWIRVGNQYLAPKDARLCDLHKLSQLRTFKSRPKTARGINSRGIALPPDMLYRHAVPAYLKRASTQQLHRAVIERVAVPYATSLRWLFRTS